MILSIYLLANRILLNRLMPQNPGRRMPQNRPADAAEPAC